MTLSFLATNSFFFTTKQFGMLFLLSLQLQLIRHIIQHFASHISPGTCLKSLIDSLRIDGFTEEILVNRTLIIQTMGCQYCKEMFSLLAAENSYILSLRST